GGPGQAPAGVVRKGAVPAQLVEHSAVVGGVDHDAHVGVVLGRRPHHGGAAHVDHLDAGLGPEGVEVADHQIDGLDALGLQVGQVLGLGAVGQDAAVDLGVEGLHPPAQHLGGAGDGLHLGVGDAGLGQGSGRAPAGEELESQGGEAGGEGLQAGLVVDGEQGSLRAHRARNSLMVCGYRRRSTALMRSWRESAVSPGRTGTASWARMGPASTSGVATWTVQPVIFTWAASASSTAWAPRKAGNRAGWVLRTRPGKVSKMGFSSTVMKPAITTVSTSWRRRASTMSSVKASRS